MCGRCDSPLIVAAREGDFAACRALVDGGARLDRPTQDGKTAVVVAAEAAHGDIVELLVREGADPTRGDAGALRRAQELWKDRTAFERTLEADDLDEAAAAEYVAWLRVHGTARAAALLQTQVHAEREGWSESAVERAEAILRADEARFHGPLATVQFDGTIDVTWARGRMTRVVVRAGDEHAFQDWDVVYTALDHDRASSRLTFCADGPLSFKPPEPGAFARVARLVVRGAVQPLAAMHLDSFRALEELLIDDCDIKNLGMEAFPTVRRLTLLTARLVGRPSEELLPESLPMLEQLIVDTLPDDERARLETLFGAGRVKLEPAAGAGVWLD